METQSAHITGIQDALTIYFYSESMSCIINNLQAILICNILNSLGIARFSINMHWHNGGSFWSDGSLYLVWIKITRCRVNVNEYRLATIPPNTVSSSYEAIWGCDDLARNTERLQCSKQW